MLDVIVCNVRLGQCVLFYPHDNPAKYSMMVDCGHEGGFHPVDLFISLKDLEKNGNGQYEIGNLTLTNYDHDHFSGLPYLLKRARFKTVNFANNLSVKELLDMKDEETEALMALVGLRNTYSRTATDYTQPYQKTVFSLSVGDLGAAGITPSTNHLSQMVFVEVGNVMICIPGDLEADSWEVMLKKPGVQKLLKKTNIFFASHHGRENGYHGKVFDYCFPDCVIISDKEVVHGTQQGMAADYGKHVLGDGIVLEGPMGKKDRRKVITTRNDGHLWINIDAQGNVRYMARKS